MLTFGEREGPELAWEAGVCCFLWLARPPRSLTRPISPQTPYPALLPPRDPGRPSLCGVSQASRVGRVLGIPKAAPPPPRPERRGARPVSAEPEGAARLGSGPVRDPSAAAPPPRVSSGENQPSPFGFRNGAAEGPAGSTDPSPGRRAAARSLLGPRWSSACSEGARPRGGAAGPRRGSRPAVGEEEAGDGASPRWGRPATGSPRDGVSPRWGLRGGPNGLFLPGRRGQVSAQASVLSLLILLQELQRERRGPIDPSPLILLFVSDFFPAS